ncbi:Cyanate permease [Halomicrobium zhouii]|uniref:Cyanate permease n=1 Tax=Halomicrobium zhouii TaxID=767519 RepID=A0A1I6LD63_9EURY|nr:MFS transporter [Halomicrobium zhouii]SFS01416.1 Cyanate permease [Halomicrobium zhouii]
MDRGDGTEHGDAVAPSSYALVVLGGVSYLLLMANWFALAAFLDPISDQLGFTGAQAGALVGAIPLTYVPLSLLTGLVLDRVGARTGIAAALAVFGVAQFLRSFTVGFPDMLATTVLLAVGATAITFGLPKLVAGVFPPRLLGTMSTVYLLGSYAGIAAAYSVGRGILGPLLGGWRPTFRVLAVVSLAFLAVWVPVALWHAREHGTPYDEGSESAFSLTSVREDVAQVFAHRAMRLLVVVGTAYLLLAHGLQGWLPTILESRGLDPGLAATVATLFVVGQAAGTLVIPPASDRLGRRRPAVVGCGVAAAGGVGWLVVAESVVGAGAAVLVAGAAVGGVSPLIRAIPTEIEDVGPALTATAVSLIFAVGELGGFAGPFLVGTLRDVTGSFVPGLVALAVGATAIVLAGMGLPERTE